MQHNQYSPYARPEQAPFFPLPQPSPEGTRQAYISHPAYSEQLTAYHNQVSPAALAFHGQIPPQAIQSLGSYPSPAPAQGGQAYVNVNPLPYNEKTTAFNNQVSPAALVFQGHISPEALQSLNQYHNPYTAPYSPVPLAPHAAHATENQNALHRGHRF